MHAYNDGGIEALVNGTSPGRPPKITAKIEAEIDELVRKGPDVETDGVVRWRCRDLTRIVEERHGVLVGEDAMGRVLHRLGYVHISARPKHPKQKPETVEDFKKNFRRSSRRP